ncbi:hypothetical protein SH528x_005196 [Novipirellula sp. SH528]|uniref:hypothetical protein n=1 Tax=Novipirellula sp. SH528 TaxID=3454466 RepID=UPI003FA0F189
MQLAFQFELNSFAFVICLGIERPGVVTLSIERESSEKNDVIENISDAGTQTQLLKRPGLCPQKVE